MLFTHKSINIINVLFQWYNHSIFWFRVENSLFLFYIAPMLYNYLSFVKAPNSIYIEMYILCFLLKIGEEINTFLSDFKGILPHSFFEEIFLRKKNRYFFIFRKVWDKIHLSFLSNEMEDIITCIIAIFIRSLIW